MPATQAARVTALLRQHGYRLRAVLATSERSESDCAALRERCDAGGWPAACDTVHLADGSRVEAIRLGREVLLRRPNVAGYLLAALEEGLPGKPRLAFGAAHAADSVILCQPSGIAATPEPARQPAELARHRLKRFFDEHPDALLIDVREACEHAAGVADLQGRAVHNLPLSRLAEHAAWLRDDARALVFFCRSGNRSLKAAQCLQGLGRERVWHLAGGLALLRA